MGRDGRRPNTILRLEANPLMNTLEEARAEIARLRAQIEREHEWAQLASKNEILMRQWAGQLIARVLRLYPDALPSLHADEAKDRERDWMTKAEPVKRTP